MDWESYKLLCDTPDVCSRWLVEQTLELLEDGPLRSRLKRLLEGAPISKPADHRGGAATDMFRLVLTPEEAASVCRRVAEAALRGETTSATRNRGLGGFVEAWQEYQRYLACRNASGDVDCSTRS